jgi:hypothetical protein
MLSHVSPPWQELTHGFVIGIPFLQINFFPCADALPDYLPGRSEASKGF